jgi:hypothetical protein
MLSVTNQPFMPIVIMLNAIIKNVVSPLIELPPIALATTPRYLALFLLTPDQIK